MSDKARAEFVEYWGQRHTLESFRREAEAAWLAAKEKYEPKNYILEPGYLQMTLQIQGDKSVRQVAKIIPLLEIERSNINVVAMMADHCWNLLTDPSTQGGGE